MNIGTTSIDSLPISQTMQPMQQQQQQMQAPPPMQQQQQQQQQQAPMQYTPDNIRLEVNNIKVDNPAQALQQTRDNDPALMQKNMNQFISGIQQASAAGMTALPSRDIPQNQDHLVQDQQIKANFIPQPNENSAGGDYISNYKTSDDIIRENMRREKKTDSLDAVYNEFQGPILIAVLFFLFQLPIIRKNMFKFLPMLFSKDGNYNISGYVSNSVLFGLAYYVMTKTINHFSL